MLNYYQNFTDEELLLHLKKQDESAFNEIYRRYWGDLYRAAFNILKDHDSCLDILQEIFIWLWNHKEQIEVKTIKTYLYVAAKYKVANYIRNGKVRDNFFVRIEQMNVDAYFNDTSIEVRELKDFIERFILDLPEKCREIFDLSRNQYLSNKQIASKLGISEKTVENQITIALNKLRKKIGANSIWLIFFI